MSPRRTVAAGAPAGVDRSHHRAGGLILRDGDSMVPSDNPAPRREEKTGCVERREHGTSSLCATREGSDPLGVRGRCRARRRTS